MRGRRRPEDALLHHYEEALRRHGDTPCGALWPNEKDLSTRFDVMLDVIDRNDDEPVTLCDLGCGTGALLAHIRARNLKNVTYVGVDRSGLALSHARAKFPDATFLEIDVGDPDADLAPLACDYLIANGLFTGKFEMTHDEMWSFLASTVRRVWPLVRRGLAFNAMSTVVEWSRDDLFHLSMDDAARLLHDIAGHNVRIRADYGLYEFTAFARKPPAPTTSQTTLPVMLPLLPPTKDLVRYLSRIDKARVYTNHGPLSREFEERICETLAVPNGSFVAAANGTAALIGTILATVGRGNGRLAIVPAYTFAATAIAVEACGFTPYFVDVDPQTWMLDPASLRSHGRLKDAALVVPVAPYGRPVSQSEWLGFRRETGVPVVIDAAASFDLVAGSLDRFTGEIPIALSFHATKSFGCGEGGGVVTTDAPLAAEIVRALNLGFQGSRESQAASINGKMSEYHAAVGLAELDGWAKKIQALRRVAATYCRQAERAGIGGRCIVSPGVSSTYALFACGDAAQARAAERKLEDGGVGFRFWYGEGVHRHRHFSMAPRDALPVTEHLGKTLLGLPVAPDLADEAIERIATTLTNIS